MLNGARPTEKTIIRGVVRQAKFGISLFDSPLNFLVLHVLQHIGE